MMAGRPSPEVMEQRRIARDPVLRAALDEKARLESEIFRVETFIQIYEELHNIKSTEECGGKQ